MKHLKINDHDVTLFSSAEDMTIRRYQRFVKFLMIDNEVGSDFDDFQKREAKMVAFMRQKMHDDAVKELENRRMNVFNAFTEYSPKSNAFAMLVYSIDGEMFAPFTGDEIRQTIDKLEEIGLTKVRQDDELLDVKKKSTPNSKSITRTISTTTKRWNTTRRLFSKCGQKLAQLWREKTQSKPKD